MKFLILGASGMAGHTIALFLKEHGHCVTGLSRRKIAFIDCVQCDVLDEERFRDVILKGSYDVIVNCVAILNNQANEQKEKAVRLNSYLPHWLANVTSPLSTRVIHISSDGIFAGNTGPYTESSQPDGTSFYARTKALGELFDNKNLTLRTSVIGPDINEDGIGLINWFMKQKGLINGYEKVIWTGITSIELARIVEFVALDNSTGLVNMIPAESISKYELLCLANKHLRGTHDLEIRPVSYPINDKTLIRNNMDSNYRVQGYERMMLEMKKWIDTHRQIYPPFYGCKVL